MSQADPAALRAEFYRLPDEALIDRQTWAAVRYVEPQTVEKEAIKGGGCPYIRIGRRALYRKADVLDWMERTGRRVENTAQLAEVAA
ncbi:MAG: DNA-binding protein [Ideonella sp.]|nr:DNA-binding protein [Ideonella sp.]